MHKPLSTISAAAQNHSNFEFAGAGILAVDEIETRESFHSCRQDWNCLLETSGKFTPFLTHEWFASCIAGFSDARELKIAVIKSDARLEAIVPLWKSREKIRGIDVRKIGFISCPDTPFADLIALEVNRADALTTLFRWLTKTSGRTWDVMSLECIPTDSPNLSALISLLKAQRKPFFLKRTAISPYIPINCPWEEYLQTRSPKFRKTRRNIINRFERLGNATVECHTQNITDAVLSDFYRIAQHSWKQDRGIAVTSRADVRSFFETLTRFSMQAGWLLLWLLKIDGCARSHGVRFDFRPQGACSARRL